MSCDDSPDSVPPLAALDLPAVARSSSAASRTLDRQTTVSLVIPCYNEQDVLPLLFDRVTAAAATWGAKYEALLVDDGSRDGTWDLITELHAKDARWKGVRLARNFGHQIALWTGLQRADGHVVAVLDADLQDPPEILARFLAKWAEGFDVIYAVRTKRKEGPAKRLAYFLYYRALAFLSEIDIPLDSGDFCVMDRAVLAAILPSKEQVPFIRGLRAWAGFRQTALAYERDRRAAGEVKYTFRKLVQLGLNGIFSFSTRPLRLATYFGFLVSGTAFLGAIFTLLQRVFAAQFERIGLGPVPGFATIVIAILFLGGVQLLCLGILGEYVGRIYENVKGRPLTVVRDIVGLAERREGGPA
jgi:glycosyltransferase involved in cell wall biosynthesis